MAQQHAVKLILFFKRKPGISPVEFEDYYEKNHVPLIEQLFPSCIQRYTRNYIQQESAIEGRAGGSDEAFSDVMTEVWFETEADFADFQHRLADPAIQGPLFADEANFIDRSTIKFYVVREKSSQYKG
ncbi:hypothetical protein Z517_08406 [Fonsecaea pedrosoi CBS 271.37]|uniref:EthD domain-containing protein n=1 Tax=Fonsecaea pedrosoi CBS 271.37 TaxID=1442368 RepID=A0A0D2GCX1_9EURO|nr:uncharacterized protein Z517_08406 [Fonsecaea pedrosoi CBS 271.37]KIW78568.1 hypothetical protein Z517_08406 [Fonsecaea pedrosoi CBS 271.37]